MSAGTMCSRVVVTATPDESARVAARRMADHEVGTVVVIEPDGVREPIGIVTDRDIAIRCVAGRLDPDTNPVSRIMSTPAYSVNEDTSVEEVIAMMARAATRRLVVIGDRHEVVGIVSLDDIVDLLVTEARSIGHLLERQQPHLSA